MRNIATFIIICFFNNLLYAQAWYKKNRELPKNHFIQNAKTLDLFFQQLDSLVFGKKYAINIVHIGDSHVQADYFTQTCRRLWQRDFGNAGRGFFIPYQLASTNGSSFLEITSEGNWEANKSTNFRDSEPFGLSGLTISTKSATSNFSLKFLDQQSRYDFLELDCFYRASEHIFPKINGFSGRDINGVGRRYFFDSLQNNISLKIWSDSVKQGDFHFFGFNAKNGHPGVLYHSVGLNGASVNSTLKNTYFVNHLKQLNPQLVVISLGTNDGYMPQSKFCNYCFKNDYQRLIDKIKEALPQVCILVSTPGDSYRYRRYHNFNNPAIRSAIAELAEANNFAIWDFNQLMGGEFSMKTWRNEGLAQYDLVHFTQEGYELMGSWLYKSILDAYEKRLD